MANMKHEESRQAHLFSDKDQRPDSQHHTLGDGPFQAAPGDHNHNVFSGSGTPETVVTAPVGSLFLRTDGGAGTTLYVKESGTGNTGWVAK